MRTKNEWGWFTDKAYIYIHITYTHAHTHTHTHKHTRIRVLSRYRFGCYINSEYKSRVGEVFDQFIRGVYQRCLSEVTEYKSKSYCSIDSIYTILHLPLVYGTYTTPISLQRRGLWRIAYRWPSDPCWPTKNRWGYWACPDRRWCRIRRACCWLFRSLKRVLCFRVGWLQYRGGLMR